MLSEKLVASRSLVMKAEGSCTYWGPGEGGDGPRVEEADERAVLQSSSSEGRSRLERRSAMTSDIMRR